MRLTTRTNLAIRALMFCGVNEGRVVRTAEIAASCNASHNHMLQVVNQLAEGGFVDTLRGRKGGVLLTRASRAISIGQLFRLFESGVPFAECFDPRTNTCPLVADCRLRGFVEGAVEAFYRELDRVTLADLIEGNCGLRRLLQLTEAVDFTCRRA